MLSKIRYYVPKNTLREIYFGIFSSLLTYGAQIWGQFHNIHIQRLMKLQDKAIRIINYADYHEPTDKLYKSSNILKLKDHINLINFMYVFDSIKGCLPHALNNNFTFFQELHDYYTRNSSHWPIELPKVRTEKYGKHNIAFRSAYIWNDLQNKLCKHNLHSTSRVTCKNLIKRHFLNNYES